MGRSALISRGMASKPDLRDLRSSCVKAAGPPSSTRLPCLWHVSKSEFFRKDGRLVRRSCSPKSDSDAEGEHETEREGEETEDAKAESVEKLRRTAVRDPDAWAECRPPECDRSASSELCMRVEVGEDSSWSRGSRSGVDLIGDDGNDDELECTEVGAVDVGSSLEDMREEHSNADEPDSREPAEGALPVIATDDMVISPECSSSSSSSSSVLSSGYSRLATSRASCSTSSEFLLPWAKLGLDGVLSMVIFLKLLSPCWLYTPSSILTCRSSRTSRIVSFWIGGGPRLSVTVECIGARKQTDQGCTSQQGPNERSDGGSDPPSRIVHSGEDINHDNPFFEGDPL